MDWTLAGSVIITGLCVVFAVLIILSLIVALMGKIMVGIGGKQTPVASAASKAAPAPVAAPASAISETEVAVITAAIAAKRGKQDFTICDIRRAN